jgi:hypothetical protein
MSAKATFNVAVVGALGLFLVGLVVCMFGPDDLHVWAKASPALWLIACAAVTLVSFVVGMMWMNGIDELAQRAHYVAWYWGGSMGLAAMMFLFLASPALVQLVDMPGLAAKLGGEVGAFNAGIATSLVFMTFGYGFWWLVFWLRKQ